MENEIQSEGVASTPFVQAGADNLNDLLPGGVKPAEKDLVSVLKWEDEISRYNFDDAYPKVVLSDELSGLATVAVNLSDSLNGPDNANPGKQSGHVSLRIIGDGHGRVYLFRDNNHESKTTIFTAKFTPSP